MSAKATLSLTIEGTNITKTAPTPFDTGTVVRPDGGIPAAKATTLTTRTDANTGTLTGSTGHGITTGAKVDLYWVGGAQYDVTVGTVSGNSIPIDGGTGDNLPIATTAINVSVHHEETITILAAGLKGIGVKTPKRGRIALLDDADAVLKSYPLADNGTDVWTADSGITIPVADDIAKIRFSHGEVTTVAMLAGFGYNT